MTEEEFGKAWAAMAKAEGHRRGVPVLVSRNVGRKGRRPFARKVPPVPDIEPVSELTVESITELAKKGCTRQQIADAHGMTKGKFDWYLHKNDLSLRVLAAHG